MKNILLLCVFFISLNLFAQSEKLDTVRYSDLSTVKQGKYDVYIGKNDAVYKNGDRIKIGVPSSNKTFAFITEGDGILIPVTQLTAASSGQQTEIKKIWVYGTKRAGYSVYFRTKGITGLSNYTINFENAVETGEVKSFGMTSDEALAELKKAKDKLDLGLISQEQYDKIKADLIKYIK